MVIKVYERTHCDGEQTLRVEVMDLKQYYKYIDGLHELEDMGIIDFRAVRTTDTAHINIYE